VIHLLAPGISILEQYRDVIIAVPIGAVFAVFVILILGALYGYCTVVSKYIQHKTADSGTTRLL